MKQSTKPFTYNLGTTFDYAGRENYMPLWFADYQNEPSYSEALAYVIETQAVIVPPHCSANQSDYQAGFATAAYQLDQKHHSGISVDLMRDLIRNARQLGAATAGGANHAYLSGVVAFYLARIEQLVGLAESHAKGETK